MKTVLLVLMTIWVCLEIAGVFRDNRADALRKELFTKKLRKHTKK